MAYVIINPKFQVKLKIKLASLSELHSKAISRPTFNDSSQDEVQIQNLSEEITRVSKILTESSVACDRLMSFVFFSFTK